MCNYRAGLVALNVGRFAGRRLRIVPKRPKVFECSNVPKRHNEKPGLLPGFSVGARDLISRQLHANRNYQRWQVFVIHRSSLPRNAKLHSLRAAFD
jgi:hypothetical protein